MTTDSPAVQQAVKLLTDRHDELERIIAEATSERQSVAAALTSLGVPVERTNAAVLAELSAVVSGPAFGSGGSVTVGRRSVRVVTLETLNSEDRVFTNDDLLAALVTEFPDRDEDQLRANLRSALFQLRKTRDVVQVSPGRHVSRRWWLPNVEDSAAATAESSIPTPSTQEEGGANGTDAPRVLDDHSSRQANHLDHGFGAPVVGA